MDASAVYIEDRVALSSDAGYHPKLRFREFSEFWKPELLGSLLEFKNGINAAKEQYGRGIKFINVLDILSNQPITYDTIVGRVDVDEITVEKNSVKYGDILFQRSSETREEVGTANVYLDEDKPAVFGGFVIRGKKIGDYDPVFFNNLLKTPLSRKQITSKSGGSTRYNVGQDVLSSIELPFPSLPEQQKIASFLSAVDEKIQLLKRKKELLEQYKKGVMQQLFSGKLRFKDESGVGYPAWKEKKLGEVANFRRGSFPQPYGLPEWFDKVSGSPFVQVYDVDSNMRLKDSTKTKISSLAAKQSVFVPEGTLILTIQGSIGRIAKTQYGAYVDRTLLIFKSYKIPINIDYFKYAVFLLFEVEKTRAAGGTIKTITKEQLSDFTVNVPSIPEQIKIAEFLCGIDMKLELVDNQITHTQTFKKGLLQQMFV